MNLRKLNEKLSIATATVLSLSFIGLSAQATMLQGYVEHKGGAPVLDSADGAPKTSDAPVPNSYPETFQGDWHCVTTVTDSGVQSVTPGSILTSDVKFTKIADGRVVGKWSQPGWTETQASVTRFTANEARVDRTNYYTADGMQNSWAARSRDQFTQTEPETITAQSYVDQYIDGQFVGRYHTKSTLHKQSEIASSTH